MIEDFVKKAREDYKAIKNILDKRNIKFFATGGTCLGAVRDHDFIKWDDDIDLGTIQPLDPVIKWNVSEDLRKKGFKACYEGFEDGGRTLAQRNVIIGLHWLEDKGDTYIFCWPDGRLAMRIHKHYIAGFTEVKLGDSTILVFSHPERYLEVKFGKDWREPIEGRHSPAIMPY